jgi:hypothetical protein
MKEQLLQEVAMEREASKGFWDYKRRSGEGFRYYSMYDLETLDLNHPYLQLVGVLSEGAKNLEVEGSLNSGSLGNPVLFHTELGWVVQYWPAIDEYPPAMCTAAGPRAHGSMHPKRKMENEILAQWLGTFAPGVLSDDFVEYLQAQLSKKNEMSFQSFQVAVELVRIAKNQGWTQIHIVAGNKVMQWAAWAAAKTLDMDLTGYEPSGAESEKISEIRYLIDAMCQVENLVYKSSLGLGLGGNYEVEEEGDESAVDIESFPEGDEKGQEESKGAVIKEVKKNAKQEMVKEKVAPKAKVKKTAKKARGKKVKVKKDNEEE